MFELTSSKSNLLAALLTVSGAVDKKKSLVILSNLLLKISEGTLLLTATDLEIEISASVPCQSSSCGSSTTVPAKKLVDIIRSLDDDATVSFLGDDKQLTIKSSRSQFRLACLSAEDYPNNEHESNLVEFTIARATLIQLLQSTHFALSQQDIRVFLNGLLLELDSNKITAVAMDGHRMAVSVFPVQLDSMNHRFVIPRKGIQELLRLLGNITEENVLVCAGKNHFKVITQQYTFISKLIETRFPAYLKAIPRGQDKQVIIDRELIKRALTRITILANEKSRAIKLFIEPNQLTVSANNPEQEEAFELLPAETTGESLQIGINASYLLDVLNYVETEKVRLSFLDTNSSILVEPLEQVNYQYVIMPMKI